MLHGKPSSSGHFSRLKCLGFYVNNISVFVRGFICVEVWLFNTFCHSFNFVDHQNITGGHSFTFSKHLMMSIYCWSYVVTLHLKKCHKRQRMRGMHEQTGETTIRFYRGVSRWCILISLLLKSQRRSERTELKLSTSTITVLGPHPALLNVRSVGHKTFILRDFIASQNLYFLILTETRWIPVDFLNCCLWTLNTPRSRWRCGRSLTLYGTRKILFKYNNNVKK